MNEKSALHTLVTNSWKASIVKALYVDFSGVYDKFLIVDMDFVVAKLTKALERMTALMDLCIIRDRTAGPCARKIGQVIMFVFNSQQL